MKLALGTVQFGLNYGVANASGKITSFDAREILQIASAAGMGMADTAIAYGDSESVLGEIGVQSWSVVTKLPPLSEDSKNVSQWVKQQVNGSLSRLGISKLYGLLLHHPVQLLGKDGQELFEALLACREEGSVRKIGVSINSLQELDTLFSRYQFDLIQAPLNIIDRRLINSGWARQLKNAGIEVHTRSAFLQGLLLMTDEKRPIKFDLWRSVWQEWARWLKETGLTPLQACVKYVVSQPHVDRIVVGVDSARHLTEIIAEANGALHSLPRFEGMDDTRLLDPTTWTQL